MAFQGNFTCNVFKTGLLNGDFDFSADAFYIALYTNNASLNELTTAYTTAGEASGGNYVAGGKELTTAVAEQDGTSYVSFNSVSWTGAITARGALIYKPGDNGAVCVLDFGADRTSTTTFTVEFPPATNSTAILRLS